MKITIREIDIEFPYYTKTILGATKFLDENRCILVSNNRFGIGIEEMPLYPSEWLFQEKATENEFMNKYNEVLEIFKHMGATKRDFMAIRQATIDDDKLNYLHSQMQL